MKRREIKTLSSTELSHVNGGALKYIGALRLIPTVEPFRQLSRIRLGF